MDNLIQTQSAEHELAYLDRTDFPSLASAYRWINQIGAESLGVERVSVWLFDEDRMRLRCVNARVYPHGVGADGGMLDAVLEMADYPAYFDEVTRSRALPVDDVFADPRTRELTPYCKEHGVCSLLDVPLRVDGTLVGILCHEKVGKPVQWSALSQLIAASLGNQLGKAIARNRRREEHQDDTPFRGLLESASDPAIIIGPDGRITYTNHSAMALFGLNEDDGDVLEKHRLQHFLAAEDKRRFDKEAYPTLLQGHVWQDVVTIQNRQGRTRPMTIMMRAHIDAHDELRCFSALLQPIIKRPEDRGLEQRPANAPNQDLLDSLWEALLVFDLDTRELIEANKTARDLLGYQTEEFRGLTIYHLIPINKSVIYHHLDQLAHQGSCQIEGEQACVRKDGSTVAVAVRATLIWQDGRRLACVFLQDRSVRSNDRSRIERLTFNHPPTGLPSDVMLRERGEKILADVLNSGLTAGFMILRIQRYEEIVDLVGHDNAAALEKQFADRLKHAGRHLDLIAHTEVASEFALIDSSINNQNDLLERAKQIQGELESRMDINGQRINIDVTFGCAMFPMHGGTIWELSRNASVACRFAQDHDRKCAVYEAIQGSRFQSRAKLEQQLRQALEHEQLFLMYQPIVAADDPDRMIKAEALVRWEHPEAGLVSPGDFIPIAGTCGLMPDLDRYVLSHAIRQLGIWGQTHPNTAVAVNLSVETLTDNTIVDHINSALSAAGVIPDRLCLEVTETAVMENWEAVQATMQQLHEHGIRLALDDFGTGYCSLAYLKHLPTQILKIDREFIGRIGQDERDERMIRTIVSLAQIYEMSVVAEGVETQEQLNWLRSEGVDFIQGFHVCRPQRSDDLEDWLARSESVRFARTLEQTLFLAKSVLTETPSKLGSELKRRPFGRL